MSHLCTVYKEIQDTIHGSIKLSKFAVLIIDNPIFQRLRKLKQLGTCNYVFPNAIHTRFEHSIGTYHLASKILDQINTNSDKLHISQCLSKIPELSDFSLSPFNSELIKIAALCHDLGHGPFSHVFDDVFIPELTKKRVSSYLFTHENRSCALLEKIIKENDILNKSLSQNNIDFMKSLINPSKQQNGFIYQIVSNNLNSLDVDKFDYIVRDSKMVNINTGFDFYRLINSAIVINDIICYPEQTLYDIQNLFSARHQFHRQIYGHKGVIASQFMIIEIMFQMEPILKLSEGIENIDKFILLTDEYILESIKLLKPYVVESLKPNIELAEKILNMLDHHVLYQLIKTFVTKTELLISKSDLSNELCDPNDILVYKNKVGYVSGNKENPMNNIFTYKTKDLHNGFEYLKATKCCNDTFTKLVPASYQEIITMIFYKNKFDKDITQKLKQKIEKII